MKISGLQKLTLLDYPGKTACTVFTYGCNLRCPFCHNAFLVTEKEDEYPSDLFFDYLKKRQGILDGVCITGGEPLIHGDLPDFIKEIRSLGFLVKLDTNGAFPSKLAPILENRLVDYIAMDVKNTPEKYGITVGIDGINVSPFLKSIELINSSGIPYEFRTTATKEFHVPEDFEIIASVIKGTEAYFIQKFKDSGNLIGNGLHPLDDEEMRRCKAFAEKVIPNVTLRGV